MRLNMAAITRNTPADPSNAFTVPQRSTKRYVKSMYGTHANMVPSKTKRECCATYLVLPMVPINKYDTQVKTGKSAAILDIIGKPFISQYTMVVVNNPPITNV